MYIYIYGCNRFGGKDNDMHKSALVGNLSFPLLRGTPYRIYSYLSVSKSLESILLPGQATLLATQTNLFRDSHPITIHVCFQLVLYHRLSFTNLRMRSERCHRQFFLSTPPHKSLRSLNWSLTFMCFKSMSLPMGVHRIYMLLSNKT